MGTSQQFSLRWNNYLKHITSAFETLRTDEDLVDVTLSCEGKRIRAHKMLLSACSTYFRDLFKENPCQHPVIIFRNVKFDDLAALVDFIYQGEVNVVQEQLDSFMTTAELLAVQGLTDGTRKDDNIADEEIEIPNEPEVQLRNVAGKVITNNKGSHSPSSALLYQNMDLHPDTPPTKRRRYRDNQNNTERLPHNRQNVGSSPKNIENKSDAQVVGSDPVEIIPLMPNMKLEIPEYLEQDGSNCSYDDQSAEGKLTLDESHGDVIDENKLDVSQNFYSNQNADTMDTSKSSDIGYLLAKPGTSAERLAADTAHDSRATMVIEQPGHACKLCGKSFWNRDSMYKHMNMHKGTTQCPVCHKVLSRTTHMKRHLKNRHGWMTVGNSNDLVRPSTTLNNPMAQQPRNQNLNANNAVNTSTADSNPTFTTIRIRESSVERITSSPIP